MLKVKGFVRFFWQLPVPFCPSFWIEGPAMPVIAFSGLV
jgi:hypothetical protein